jgi:hypothetical protein
MPARAALQTLLEEDVPLAEIGLQAVYPTNAVDTPAEDLFLVIRWDPTSPAFKTTGSDRVQIWCHDTQRDYGRITQVLERLKVLLPGTVHLQGADGYSLTTAEWNGEGPDLFDGGYNTVTRYADFTVVSRYTDVG